LYVLSNEFSSSSIHFERSPPRWAQNKHILSLAGNKQKAHLKFGPICCWPLI